MHKRFYIWSLIGLGAAVILAVYLTVLIKTARSGANNNYARQETKLDKQFEEVELRLKKFQTINKLLFDQKAAEAKEELIQKAALQKLSEKLKEKLESATSTK